MAVKSNLKHNGSLAGNHTSFHPRSKKEQGQSNCTNEHWHATLISALVTSMNLPWSGGHHHLWDKEKGLHSAPSPDAAQRVPLQSKATPASFEFVSAIEAPLPVNGFALIRAPRCWICTLHWPTPWSSSVWGWVAWLSKPRNATSGTAINCSLKVDHVVSSTSLMEAACTHAEQRVDWLDSPRERFCVKSSPSRRKGENFILPSLPEKEAKKHACFVVGLFSCCQSVLASSVIISLHPPGKGLLASAATLMCC